MMLLFSCACMGILGNSLVYLGEHRHRWKPFYYLLGSFLIGILPAYVSGNPTVGFYLILGLFMGTFFARDGFGLELIGPHTEPTTAEIYTNLMVYGVIRLLLPMLVLIFAGYSPWVVPLAMLCCPACYFVARWWPWRLPFTGFRPKALLDHGIGPVVFGSVIGLVFVLSITGG